MKRIYVKRPPLAEGFELPTREQLLAVEVGSFVKLIFTNKNGDNGERMWVKVKDKVSSSQWDGELANEPFGLNLKWGSPISFHPLDIISIQD